MATLKQLKKILKKAGLKTTGSKRALTRRAKKARLMRGGVEPKTTATPPTETGVSGSTGKTGEGVPLPPPPPSPSPAPLPVPGNGMDANPGGRRTRYVLPRGSYGTFRRRTRGFF